MIKKLRFKKTYISLLYSILFGLTFLFSFQFSYADLNQKDLKAKFDFFRPAIKELEAHNVDSSFIYYLLSDPDTKFEKKYVKINVTGFLKKPDYSQHYNDYSVKKTVEFLAQNREVFNECQKQYRVPEEVIAAVLWIETKNGAYLGHHQLPTVFLSTAMADCDKYIDMNEDILHDSFKGSRDSMRFLERKIKRRAARKSKWAIKELGYLEKIYEEGNIDVLNLRGSWAGAFGMPQFLPSSYIKWAVDGNDDGSVDLFNADDAINSIGNYLHINGWGPRKSQQQKALFHYNNSQAYVDAVMILASKVKKFIRFSLPLAVQLKGI